MRTRAGWFVIALLFAAPLAPAARAGDAARFVVAFRARPDEPTVRTIKALGARTLVRLDTIDALIVTGPQSMRDPLKRLPAVTSVELDGRIRFFNYQTEDQTGEGAVKRGLPPLPRAFTGAGVTVAVFDSGVDTNHPDLAGQVIEHLNFDGLAMVPGDQATRDKLAQTGPTPQSAVATHGLSVGGILAGTGAAAAGGVDMTGVAPGARIVDLITCCTSGALTQIAGIEAAGSDMLVAYDYMIRHRNDPHYPGGIRVATNQWGFLPGEPYPHDALRAILLQTRAAGITLVFSAGNGGPAEDTVGGPQNTVEELITVGASCPAIDGGVERLGEPPCSGGEIAEYSSRGVAVDIAAPASGVWAPKYPTVIVANGDYVQPRPGPSDPVATANNRIWYGKFGGTSAAAPYIAGVVALMLEADPSLTPAEIESILTSTARDYGERGRDTTWGAGEVDALAAVLAALA